jgi:hypothetical protein
LSPPPPPTTVGELILAALAAVEVVAPSLASTVAISGTTITYAQIVGTATLIATSAAIQLSMTPKIDPGQAQRNIRQSVPSRRAFFGRVKTGGPMLLHEDKGPVSHRIIALCDGPIDAIEEFWLIDRLVAVDGSNDVIHPAYNPKDTRLAKIFAQMGAPDQTHHAALAAALPTVWTADHRLRGIANLYIQAQSTSAKYTQVAWPSGFPEASPVYRAKLCYDPRLDSTEGGSGTHRKDDPTTWAWTQNPALVILFYLTHQSGFRLPWARINLDSFRQAANDCDELVPLKAGGTAPRYRCGGGYSYDERPIVVLRRFMSSCDGRDFLDDQGRVGIRVGVWREPTVTIKANSVLGYEMVNGRSKLESANVIRGKYSSPLHNYELVDADEWINQASVDLSGRKPAEWDGSVVQDHGQMRRLMKRAALAAAPKRTLRLKTDLTGEQAENEFVIAVEFEDGPHITVQETFEVLRVESDLTSASVMLELQSIDAGHYAWDATAEEGTAPAVPPDSEGFSAPVPANLVVTVPVKSLGGGVTAPVLRVACDPVARADITFMAEYKLDGATEWLEVIAPAGVFVAETPPLAVGTYDVRARFLVLGAEQPATSIVENVVVANPAAAPSSPVSFTAVNASGTVTLTATSPNHLQHRALRFWRGATNVFAAASDITGQIVGAANTVTVRTDTPGTGDWWYWVTSEFDATSRSAPAGPVNISTAFDPLALFTGGYTGAYCDFTDMSTLFQATGLATPVTASGQTVGSVDDLSPNNTTLSQATAGSRPVFTVSGALSYLTFDGTDDHFTVSCPVGSSWTAVLCYRKAAATDRAIGFGGSGGSAVVSVGDTTGQRINGAAYNLTPGAGVTLQGPAASGGKTNFGVASAVNIGQAAGELYYNKTALTTSNQTAAATHPSTWNRFGCSSQFSKMDVTGFFFINRALTTTERNDLETFMAAKAGVTI